MKFRLFRLFRGLSPLMPLKAFGAFGALLVAHACESAYLLQKTAGPGEETRRFIYLFFLIISYFLMSSLLLFIS